MNRSSLTVAGVVLYTVTLRMIQLEQNNLPQVPHQLTWASWRWFTLACAGPSLLVCLVFILLPESPKFLLCQGRHDD